jgi:hypothetical protein
MGLAEVMSKRLSERLPELIQDVIDETGSKP